MWNLTIGEAQWELHAANFIANEKFVHPHGHDCILPVSVCVVTRRGWTSARPLGSTRPPQGRIPDLNFWKKSYFWIFWKILKVFFWSLEQFDFRSKFRKFLKFFFSNSKLPASNHRHRRPLVASWSCIAPKLLHCLKRTQLHHWLVIVFAFQHALSFRQPKSVPILQRVLITRNTGPGHTIIKLFSQFTSNPLTVSRQLHVESALESNNFCPVNSVICRELKNNDWTKEVAL